MTSDGTPEAHPIDPLRFVGQRDRPQRPEEIARRRPVLGTTERPVELERLASRRSIYVRSNLESEPQPDVGRVEEGDGDLWRIDIPVDPGGAPGAIPGRTGVARKPEEILAEIDPAVDYGSYRPEWIDALPLPRALPGAVPPPMLRLDRRRLVQPFQTTRFPPEERQPYQDASWPWGLVGKIFTSTGGWGSAVLIGNRLVVTARHVVPGGDGWWMRFVPACFDGISLHGSGVESYVSDWTAFDTGGAVVGYDWAVCRLYEPLGSWLGFMGTNGYDDDWEDQPYWAVAGYPSAIAGGDRPSYQLGVSVFDDDSDSNGGQELETRADLSPGNSGGPMWGTWGDQVRALGVVSGEEYDWAVGGGEWGNVVAGGPGFSNLVTWGRTNWP